MPFPFKGLSFNLRFADSSAKEKPPQSGYWAVGEWEKSGSLIIEARRPRKKCSLVRCYAEDDTHH